MSDFNGIDSLLPPQIAAKAEEIGVKKGSMAIFDMFLLSILAGAFISMGAIFCTTVLSGNGAGGAISLPFGLMRLLGGVVFCLGLILVVICGAELFTGNVLLIMATVSRKLSVSKLLWNWFVVYIGNFIGSVATAYLMYLTGHFTLGSGEVGLTTLAIGELKCALPFMTALTRGIYCNALVCLAVWMCFSCRTTTDKILAILFPITAFVAAGFEHSVANMYFIPIAMFVKEWAAPEFWGSIGKTASNYSHLTWNGFLITNLIPVTIGNIIGGGLFVGIIYWLVYCRPRES